MTSSLDELEAEEKIMQQGNDDAFGNDFGLGKNYEGNEGLRSAMTINDQDRRIKSLESKLERAYLELRNEHSLKQLNED